jgi:hypothetical protein
MILGHGLLSYVPFAKIAEGIRTIPLYIDTNSFLIMYFFNYLLETSIEISMQLGYSIFITLI